ncbi:MAG: hypothetical protein HKN52_01910 [Eudoraea sp.]|nr:hypothetical protein [Muriicola sp.]NNE01894.1 hypothetical protein [Eudoraea sp.]
MKNISKIGVLLLFALVTNFVVGQKRPGMEKIKSLKIAFITERLALSSEEATVFWPVYNEHEKALENIRTKERQDIRGKLRNFNQMSDQEIRGLMDEFLELEKEKTERNHAFLKKMSDLISARKTFMLIKAEEDFKRRLLQQIQQRRQ